MKRYFAGQTVDYGVYASTWPPDMHFVGADGETLLGKAEVGYVRLPTLLVVAAGPLLGGAFVMLFPLLILAAVALAATRLVAKQLGAVTERHAHLATVRWEPTAAYLNRSSDGKATSGEQSDKGADALDELEPEVEERLAQEREAKNN